jgi:hypothetical protein
MKVTDWESRLERYQGVLTIRLYKCQCNGWVQVGNLLTKSQTMNSIKHDDKEPHFWFREVSVSD